ncbi:hypothetical protein IFR05_014588 [Cadophora sp. M221]|nr:hypothetical protein IFR05_014588 [Cadophora sp. M221]
MARANINPRKRSRDKYESCTVEVPLTREGKYPKLATRRPKTPKDQPPSKVIPKIMHISWDAYHKLSERHTTTSKPTDELLKQNRLFLVTKKPTSDHETTKECVILGDFNTWEEALQFFQQHRMTLGDMSGPTMMQKMEVNGNVKTDQTLLRAVGSKWDMSIVMHCFWDEGIDLEMEPDAIELSQQKFYSAGDQKASKRVL